MKPAKPRVLWALFDRNGFLCFAATSRRNAIRFANAYRYEEGCKAVKFVEQASRRKAKASKAARRKP